jgi:dGTPase
MNIREKTEAWELEHLEPYACFSRKTKGRRYPEGEDETRTAFQHDRDRVIHTSAFRRLEYKTQVFVYHEGDYFRTRLTHTIEVAQIARTLARSLGVNEDLTEAVALSHDLGHPPFGHSGETTLNELMKDDGGFNHNVHSLRIVDELEKKYPEFDGLNLTYEVREGIAKHATDYDNVGPSEFLSHPNASLEGQIVDIADEIAYNSHDIDDGIASGMLSLADMVASVRLWRETYTAVREAYPDQSENVVRLVSVSRIIGRQVADVVDRVREKIQGLHIKTVEDIRHAPERIGVFSAGMAEMNEELKDFLMKNLYRQHRVVRMSGKAERILKDLFRTYLDIPEQLPPDVYQVFFKSNRKKRVISDYIAQMTDKFAIDEHNKLFNPYERV